MIQLIESLPDGSGYFYERLRGGWLAYHSLAQALFYHASPNEAIIGVVDADMTVSGCPEPEEFLSFLRMMPPRSLCCDPALAERLNLDYELRVIMERPPEPGGGNENALFPEAPEVYRVLSFGADGDLILPEYPTFALDYSFKCRRGLAGAVVLESSAVCVASVVTETAVLISGVAVSPDVRGNGLGRRAVLELCRRFPGKTAMLLCRPETAGFYQKCGFQTVSAAAVCLFGGKP